MTASATDTDLAWPGNGARVEARNTRTARLLAGRARVASTRRARAVGLLNARELPAGEGLWIVPSRGVHTVGMRFAIDVVALDAKGRVVDVAPRLRPWRVRLPRGGSVGVLELPPGTIAASGTQLGDRIVFERVPDESHVRDGRAA
jgi:hypothetical protein